MAGPEAGGWTAAGDLTLCWAQSPLHEAVAREDRHNLLGLLEAGREGVNTLQHGVTPLHLACRLGKPRMAAMLLDSGADINAGDIDDRKTALHITSCSGKRDLTALLTASGADANIRDVQGQTPLWLAAQHGHQGVLNHLLTEGVDVNVANQVGISPLAVAVLNGNKETVPTLVSAGARVDHPDFVGNTPLFHAVKGGQREITRLLTQAGADPNRVNHAGDVPVHTAALHGNTVLLELLIEAGSDVNVMSTSGPPIALTVRRQHVRATEILVSAGAQLDTQDLTTPLPLVEAILQYNPNLDLLRALVQGGCDVNRTSLVFEMTPIEYTLLNDRQDAAFFLLEADCEAPRKLDFVDLSRDSPALLQRVKAYFRQPLTLKRLCRKLIRKMLGYGYRYEEKVLTLQIPTELKRFLCYSDLPPTEFRRK